MKNAATERAKGKACAEREFAGVRVADIKAYLASCEEMGKLEGKDDFDRAYMETVKKMAGT